MSGIFSSTARAIRSAATRLTIGAIADGQVLKRVGTAIVGAAAGGDASGPASSTDNAAARFDGTGGKTLQNSVVIIGDTGNVTGVGTLNTHTLPAGTDTLVGRASTDTLTNKTLTSPAITTPTGIVKGDVGLGNVDNTSDAAKPVSTAQQTALDLKANLVSPTFVTPTLGVAAATSINFGGTALANYVEGTWTPVVAFGGASVGVTYAVQQGWYTRIGDVVHAWAYVALSSKGSSTGNAAITGLPIASGSTTNRYTDEPLNLTNATYTGQAWVEIAPSGTSLGIAIQNNGSLSLLTDAGFANNTSFILRITYRTN